MRNEYNKQLYELLMRDISVIVKTEINESYDNMLLEEYDVKDILNTVSTQTNKNAKIFYQHLKKFIIYVITNLQKTQQYKKADKIMQEYKKQVTAYIDKHKKITPRRMLKIIITVLTIYGGVSVVQDCKSFFNTLNNDIKQIEDTRNYIDDTDIVNKNDKEYTAAILDQIDTKQEKQFIEDIEKEIDNNKKVNVNKKNLETPSLRFKKDKNYEFKSSSKSHKFIKKHEMCLLYPYYATEAELKQGKVTIGYGHVVIESDGELYKKVQLLKKKGLIKPSFVYDKKKKSYALNKNHCKYTITEALADKLFKKDIKIAENRAYKAIMNMETDKNVKCFMLYNQNIIDGLTSLCYNAGSLKQDKYSFITKGLSKCRYDYTNNCINKGDYNVSFSYFKNIKDNPNRRNEEYQLFFLNANKQLS